MLFILVDPKLDILVFNVIAMNFFQVKTNYWEGRNMYFDSIINLYENIKQTRYIKQLGTGRDPLLANVLRLSDYECLTQTYELTHQCFREHCGRVGREIVRAWGMGWELWHSESWTWRGWCLHKFTAVVDPSIRTAQIQASQNSSMNARGPPPLAKELYWVMAAEEGRISFLWRHICW